MAMIRYPQHTMDSVGSMARRRWYPWAMGPVQPRNYVHPRYYPYAQLAARPMMQVPQSVPLPAKVPAGTQSIDNATYTLVKFLEKEKDSVCESLAHCRGNLSQESLEPLYTLQVIANKLSQEVFLDLGRIEVCLSPSITSLMGRTSPAGVRTNSYGITNQVPIIDFNPSIVHRCWQQPRGRLVVVGLLIHQLIHAYLFTKCKPPAAGEEDARIAHDHHFGAILLRLKQISRRRDSPDQTYGLDYFELGTGACHWLLEKRRHFPAPPLNANRCPTFTSTRCRCAAKKIDEDFLEAWIREDLKSAADPKVFKLEGNELKGKPKSEHGDANEFFLFRCEKKLYMIPKRSAAIWAPSLQEKFRNDSKMILDLPKLSDARITDLLKFCNVGNYGKPLNTTKEKDGCSPPLIKALKASAEWPAYLLQDVEMYKLGRILGISELDRKAMERLNSQHISHEDPFPVIEAIFDSSTGEVPTGLQEWFYKWLLRTDSAMKIGQNPKAVSNWNTISKSPLYQTLCQKLAFGNLLQEHMCRVELELSTKSDKGPDRPPLPQELFTEANYREEIMEDLKKNKLSSTSLAEAFHARRPAVWGEPEFLRDSMAYRGLPYGPYDMYNTMPYTWGEITKTGDNEWKCDLLGTRHFAVWRNDKWRPGLQPLNATMSQAALGKTPAPETEDYWRYQRAW